MLNNEFYKVSTDGYGYVTATLFNPVTLESKTVVVFDIDDCSRDNPEVSEMPINKEALNAFIHHNGGIVEGDTVKVVKGRKLPIGTVGIVKQFREIRDRYGRYLATYVVFEDGKQTNQQNVERVA